jgi:hypothetical protein
VLLYCHLSSEFAEEEPSRINERFVQSLDYPAHKALITTALKIAHFLQMKALYVLVHTFLKEMKAQSKRSSIHMANQTIDSRVPFQSQMVSTRSEFDQQPT